MQMSHFPIDPLAAMRRMCGRSRHAFLNVLLLAYIETSSLSEDFTVDTAVNSSYIWDSDPNGTINISLSVGQESEDVATLLSHLIT